jgi:hypothetical protein
MQLNKLIIISLALLLALGGCAKRKARLRAEAEAAANSTTIKKEEDNKNEEVAIPDYLYITDFGAKGDGITDDTEALIKAIESNTTGQPIYFPNGTYLINETKNRGSCVYISSNTTLEGESVNGTTIKLKGHQRDGVRMFSTQQGARNISISNIKFDGNVQEHPSKVVKTEHMHAIFIHSSENVRISNCNFTNAKGDGVYIHGPVTQSKDIYITDCKFSANERNAITLGSGFKNVVIDKCEIDASATHCPIDSEPFKGICEDVTIKNCSIYSNNFSIKNPIVTLGGFPTKVVGYKIHNNTLTNVGIHMVTADDVYIYDNKITTTGEVPCVNATYENANINITNNKLMSDVETIRAMATKHSHPFNITIKENNLVTKSKTLASMILFGVKDVRVLNNNIYGPLDNNYAVFNLRSTRDLSNVLIKGNTAYGFAQAANVRTYQKYKVQNVVFEDNTFNIQNQKGELIQLGAYKELIDVKQKNNSNKTDYRTYD